MLIAAGAGVDEAGPDGRTALHFADGHLDMLQLLIASGANVNGRDEEGASPLDEAAWGGSLDTAAPADPADRVSALRADSIQHIHSFARERSDVLPGMGDIVL